MHSLAEDTDALAQEFRDAAFPMDKTEISIYNGARSITHKIYNGLLSTLEGSILLQNLFQMHLGEQIIKVLSCMKHHTAHLDVFK